MAKLYSISDVANIAINKAADVTEEIIDAGRQFYCSLHQNHPAWTVAREFSDLSIILRAIDQMCEDGGTYVPPPAPQPPFEGGQCCDATYDVFVPYIIRRCFNNQISLQDANGGVRVTGKVLGVRFDYIAGSTNSYAIIVDTELCNGSRQENFVVQRFGELALEPCFTNNNQTPGAFRDSRTASEFFIDRVVRVDGQPDNCGSLPPEYPDEPDPTDPELTSTVTVTNINNETYDYDVTVNRDTNNTINFPPTIVVNDVTITMDITGITVINNNNTQKPSGGGSGGVAEEEPVEPQDENAGKELLVQPGTIEEDVPDIYAVIVDITNIPVNAKVSSGFGAPDKIFPGWLEFKVGSDYLPRQFIDFENSYFFAPEDATGYAITILTGYSASIFKAFFVEV